MPKWHYVKCGKCLRLAMYTSSPVGLLLSSQQWIHFFGILNKVRNNAAIRYDAKNTYQSTTKQIKGKPQTEYDGDKTKDNFSKSALILISNLEINLPNCNPIQ